MSDSRHGPVHPVVLAIESSCDETSVAVLDGKARLLGERTFSQIAAHQPFGGVVPELASRNHTLALPGILDAAMLDAGVGVKEIDVFAATAGPGLASSLLVGNTTAKALALATGKPFLAINHLEGHLLSPFFGPEPVPESLVLVVSGGHTLLVHLRGVGDYRLLGRSKDDAAGEAFDKVGKMLGLPYPGGPEIDRLAATGNPSAVMFPRSMSGSGDFDFSFSGLKTAVRTHLAKLPGDVRQAMLADICASFQEAVVDVLVSKSLAAARYLGVRILGVGGGVACNRRLQAKLRQACADAGVDPRISTAALATDNAAMIAFAALHHHIHGDSTPLDADVDPNFPLSGLGVLRGQAAANAVSPNNFQ